MRCRWEDFEYPRVLASSPKIGAEEEDLRSVGILGFRATDERMQIAGTFGSRSGPIRSFLTRVGISSPIISRSGSG